MQVRWKAAGINCDSIRQCKACHPVVLTIFQGLAGITANNYCQGKLQQENGERGKMRFPGCYSVSSESCTEAGDCNTLPIQGEGRYKQLDDI